MLPLTTPHGWSHTYTYTLGYLRFHLGTSTKLGIQLRVVAILLITQLAHAPFLPPYSASHLTYTILATSPNPLQYPHIATCCICTLYVGVSGFQFTSFEDLQMLFSLSFTYIAHPYMLHRLSPPPTFTYISHPLTSIDMVMF